MRKLACQAALLLAAIMLVPMQSLAQEPMDTAVRTERPRIGLALSGGGARGGAHIGVLLALRDLGIPIDYVAGTSMGSIIGGLYASGLTEAEIEQLARELDWMSLFFDKPSRDDRSFRRKRDDELYLIERRAGFNEGTLELPMGFIQGQNIELELTKLLLPVADIDSFDDLAIPFRAVAADIVTGEAVILDDGNLAKALRASLSLPAILAPVEINGRLLVDGGIAQNLPVDTVRAMGADIVIAVDISTPLSGREELTSALSIASQLTGLLTTRGTAAQIAKLTSADALISPELGDITTMGFDRITETFAIGYEATMAVADELRALALSPADYQAHRASRPSPRESELPQVSFIQLRNESPIGNNIIDRRLDEIPLDTALDIEATESAIRKLYGLELFQHVRYGIVSDNGERGLEIEVDERDWGPNYIQGGIEYSSTGDDNSLFSASLSYLRTAMNSLGAEWRSTIKLGGESSLSTNWHQPMGWDAKAFTAIDAAFDSAPIKVYDEGTAIAEIRVRQPYVGLAVGREFGSWGEARLGILRGTGNTKILTGDPSLPILGDFDRGEYFARFTADRLDSLYFPTRGGALRAEWRYSRDSIGADTNFDQFSLTALGAKTLGRHTLAASVRYGSTTDGIAPIQNLYRIGGFWNLSGFPQNELTGQNSGRALLSYYHRLGDSDLFPVFAGMTYEKGNIWDNKDDISFANSIDSRAIWVGAKTPIGPVYLAYGRASGGRDSFYVYLGSAF
jgi:NTE family protein